MVISDIDDRVTNSLLELAEYNCVTGVEANLEDAQKLQDDSMNLCKGSTVWLKVFNVDNCKFMHLGYNNTQVKYETESKILEAMAE
jgi:hypothetical protein